MYGSISSLEKLGFIIRIRSLTFSSNFYRLIWFCSLFVATSIPNDAKYLTLVVEAGMTTCQRRRSVAENFRAEALMKLIGD